MHSFIHPFHPQRHQRCCAIRKIERERDLYQESRLQHAAAPRSVQEYEREPYIVENLAETPDLAGRESRVLILILILILIVCTVIVIRAARLERWCMQQRGRRRPGITSRRPLNYERETQRA